MTINLYLLGEKAYRCLCALNDAQGVRLHVVVGRDNNMLNDYSSDIVAACERLGFEVFKRGDAVPVSDFSIAIGWRWMIEDATGLIVFHDSLLPRLRGFNPLVTALINGDDEVGVTALFASSHYDRGGIISQLSLKVVYPIKIQSAISLVSGLYVKLFIELYAQLSSGLELKCVAQNETQATYSLWRGDDDYLIDWSLSSAAIRRKIDAVGTPYLGARARLKGEYIIINNATEVEDVVIENRSPGKVIWVDDGIYPVVVCGEGLLRIKSAVYFDGGDNCLPFKSFRSKLH